MGDRAAVPLAVGLLAVDHRAAVHLVVHLVVHLALEVVVHRLHLEAAVFRLPLEVVVLRVAIALEGQIPFPVAVLPTDTRLVDIRLDTHLVIAAAPPLALEMASGLP